MNATGTIELSVENRVGVLTLRRPDKLNALAGDMRLQIRDAVVSAATSPGIRGLVVTGEGRAFCAGGDVAVMTEAHAAGDEAGFRKILHAGAECVLAIQAFPGLTVAAVNGIAAGAGLGLALACDFRIGAPEARFAASWARIGLAPDWGATHFLPRLLGRSRALRFILDAETVDSAEALALGLLDEIVEPGALLERAHATVHARGAAAAMARSVKALVQRGANESVEAMLAAETEIQEELFAGDDVGEGLAAFHERRPPRFGDDR